MAKKFRDPYPGKSIPERLKSEWKGLKKFVRGKPFGQLGEDVKRVLGGKPRPKFDPEGPGYDTHTAKKYGLKATGNPPHWPSREPRTGMILKGRAHPTWAKTVAGEEAAGYKITKRNGRYYSFRRPGGI